MLGWPFVALLFLPLAAHVWIDVTAQRGFVRGTCGPHLRAEGRSQHHLTRERHACTLIGRTPPATVLPLGRRQSGCGPLGRVFHGASATPDRGH